MSVSVTFRGNLADAAYQLRETRFAEAWLFSRFTFSVLQRLLNNVKMRVRLTLIGLRNVR